MTKNTLTDESTKKLTELFDRQFDMTWKLFYVTYLISASMVFVGFCYKVALKVDLFIWLLIDAIGLLFLIAVVMVLFWIILYFIDLLYIKFKYERKIKNEKID